MHYLDLDAKMEYSKLENGQTLDEQGRIGSNLSLAHFANNSFFSLLSKIVQLFGYTYILVTLHPFVIIAILIMIFLNSLISKKLVDVDYTYQQTISSHQRRFTYLFRVLTEYSFAKETRINHADTWIQSKFAAEQQEYIKQFSKHQNTHFRCSVLTELLLCVQTLLLYLYCVLKVVSNSITIGDFSLYIGTTTAFIGCAISILDQIRKTKSLSQYIDDYRTFVEQANTFHHVDCQNDILESNSHEIEFENVSFIYPGQNNFALKNVSFKIKAGERLAIVGYNGAGKSTLIKLICRLYTPTEGRILHNGTDISTLKYEQYSQLLSVVFQDFNIYSMSVKENIVLNGNTNEIEIISAVEKSGLADTLKTLPYGLDTQLGKDFDEKGIEFSGGESQKLSCARAYYRNTSIIILDEPTASLDPISEQQLYKRFNEIMGNKTAIYITHRLASVRFCDNIAVLMNGEMVEYGTHKELMKNRTIYYDMFTKQANYYTDQLQEET
jgi:ABC-type multidrug transport system fused ATPase/permease subunit